MNEKIKVESNKKFTDSDEEILDEVKIYQEKIGKEIEDEIKLKTEEFKKIALKNIDKKEKSELGLSKSIGGLIPSTTGESKKQDFIQNTCFEEIIGNIGQAQFDIENYSEINKVLTRKNEQKWERRNQSTEVDYTKGGLQTFEKKNKKEYGLLINSESKSENEYFDEGENEINNLCGDIYQDSYLNRKRVRDENSNPYLELPIKKIYGVSSKPKSRNIEEQVIDDNDYEAFYMPEDKYKIEHDINKPNPLKREYEE